MKRIFKFTAISFLMTSNIGATESMLSTVDSIRKAMLEPTRAIRDILPIRQADAGFIVEKSWVEKDANGAFIGKRERICTQKFRVNVYDVRNTSWNYPPMNSSTSCATTLDSRDGTKTHDVVIDLGGFIYLNHPAGGVRDMKNFAPWAYPRTRDGEHYWAMNGMLVTPDLDLQEIAFMFGSQPDVFFQNQTITVTATFTDKMTN